jgi:hypothetical protein
MFEGRNLLNRLKSVSGTVSSAYTYNNMLIKGPSLEKGIELYQTGIDKFLGNSLIKRLENIDFTSNSELQKRLAPDQDMGKGDWVDLAGLITPKEAVENLLDDIESERINTLDQLAGAFAAMHKSYYDWEWTWACKRIEEETGKPVSEFTASDVVMLTERWKSSVVGLDKLLYEDARKEFNLSSRTGFGIDDGDEVKRIDFEQVRGDFDTNGVVAAIQDHILQKTTLGDELIERMGRITSP